jgi:hypothetical protein
MLKTRVTKVCWIVAVTVATLAAAGCGPHNELVLEQAFAPPSQQQMTLASDWGYSGQSGQRRRCLLAFPLPLSRADNSPRDFLVYLDLPGSEGEFEIDPAAPGAANGFMIQKKGELAGIAYFASGTVRIKRVLFRPALRKLEIDIVCEDSTVVRGSARVRAAPSEVHAFEQRYAADLGRLGKATTQPSDAPDATAPRASGGE